MKQSCKNYVKVLNQPTASSHRWIFYKISKGPGKKSDFGRKLGIFHKVSLWMSFFVQFKIILKKMLKGESKVKILMQGVKIKMEPSGPISLKFCMQGSLVCTLRS